MIRRLGVVFLALMCLLGLMGNARHEGRTSSTTSWEYKIFVVPPPSTNEQTEQKLSQLGSQGWELVQLNAADGTGGGVYYFKRAK